MKRRDLFSTALAAAFSGLAPVPGRAARIAPGISLGIASAPNLRDLGGYTTSSGATLRYGLVYRSEKLNPMSAVDQSKLAALDLGQVYDLRLAYERAARPDELPPHISDVWLNVMADADTKGFNSVTHLLANPKQASAALDGGKMALMLENVYREFVSLPSARKSYGTLLTSLARADTPQLFHCTAGKDRTGWAAATLMTLLGVPRDQVFADYLRTNEYILPEYQPVMAKFIAAGGSPVIMHDMFLAKPAYLQSAFDEAARTYGSMQGYFEAGLGLDKATQAKLKARFIKA